MSIKTSLAERVHEGAIFEIIPLLPSSRGQPRSVWAESSLFEQLTPETASEEYRLEAGRLRRKLESIASGNRVVVGGRRNKYCDIKRLEPSSHEVWEIRERNSPSIRIFFRFIEKDCITTTNLRFVSDLFSKIWERGGLEYWPVWRTEIRRCKAIWRNLFPVYSPHSGVTLNEYLSNATEAGNF